MSEETKAWKLQVMTDARFGLLAIVPISPEGEPVAQFQLRLGDLLREAGFRQEEILEFRRLAQNSSVPFTDSEPFRHQAIEALDLKGKTVLDVGGYNGWAAKKCLDLGAERAICLDNQQYDSYGWVEQKFEEVQYVEGDMMDYRLEGDGIWGGPGHFVIPRPDVLIIYNVLYHLKNPWAFLDRARSIIKPDGVMLLCTLFRYHEGSWIYLYEPRECNPTDDTVYFGPSLTALERLLKATGWDFSPVGYAMDRVVYSCTPTPGFVRTHEDS